MRSDGEPGATAAPSPSEALMLVMDLQQEQLARSMGEGHRVIHGVAGSGKTMILVYRAQQLAAAARPDWPILVLCYNRPLAARIDALMRQRGLDERVQVRTFHGWCYDMADTYQLGIPKKGFRPDYDALADRVVEAVAHGRIPRAQYAALMIDEAHDFEDAWLRLAPQLVDPATNSLLVLYDDAQSIYRQPRRRFSFASVGIEARGRTSVLKVNYRNTAEILEAAARAPSGGNLQPWRVYALAGEPLAQLKAQVAANPMGEPMEYDVYPPDLWEPLRTRRFKNGEEFTDKVWAMENRRIYRGIPVEPGDAAPDVEA